MTNFVEVPGGKLAAYSFGQGPPVIFLHGGPGDTHDYMKRMAEPLFDSFRCIFFDQRGSGGSSDFKRAESEFKVDLMLNDLCAIASHFGAKRPALVGHSWGAMYALFACLRFPREFGRAALVSMGPLDSETARMTADHLTSVLTLEEKAEWTDLRKQRNAARDAGDKGRLQELDRKLMHLRVKAWVFNPALRSKFLEEYFLDPPPDRNVNQWVWSSVETWFDWSSLRNLESELWLCTGANDSVPLTQVDRILSMTTKAKATVVDQCGHIPWLEHPELYYRELKNFLTE